MKANFLINCWRRVTIFRFIVSKKDSDISNSPDQYKCIIQKKQLCSNQKVLNFRQSFEEIAPWR
jgi:hypothetical protein